MTPKEASLLVRWSRCRCGLRSLVLLAGGTGKFDDGYFAICEEGVPSCVGKLFRRAGTVHSRIGGRRPNKEEIRLDPLAFAVNVWINAV